MFQQNLSSNRQKLNGCSFRQLLRQNLGWLKTLCLRGFILKPRERAQTLLKNGTRDFQNSPAFERSVCFYAITTGNFDCFHYFIFDANFLKDENLFQKTGVPFLQFKILRLKAQYFHTKLPCQKPMLRPIEWTYHKGRSFATNYFIFLKFLFQSKNLF